MSSIGTDEESDKWLDIDDNLSIPTQTVDEILAERNEFLDEELSGFEDDDSCLFALDRASSHSVVPISYKLGSPISLQKEESISHQISSVKDRPTGGTACALAICTSHLAVGTTRGLTLIFERTTGKLAQFVHVGKEYGSVSSLDFSLDSSKLAIGFSRGGLVIFGCHTKKVISEFEEIGQAGRGILHVKYVSNQALILVDNGGSVFEVHERVRKKRNARCIFTGCKGEVVNICVIACQGLILLASLKQVLVLSIQRGAVVAQLRLNGPSIAPPLIDWRKRVLQVTARASVKEVRICLARGSEVRIHQIQSSAATGSIICPLLKVIRVPNEEVVINIKWVDDFHLLLLTSRETIHLVEIHKGMVIASTQASDLIDLVYNSADFKGLATGGNVSAAMEAMSNNVCYQSFVRLDKMVYVIGQTGLFTVTVLDQAAQLDSFVDRGEIASALLYSIDIYEGRVRDKSVNADLRVRISSRISFLIVQLLELTTGGISKGSVNELLEHYKRNILVLQRACVATSHFDLLYNTVYPRLEKDPLSRSIFLELLDEIISDDLLDQPPACLVHDYLTYLIAEGQFSQFELAVTKLPIDRLDIHQVMTTCRHNQLFDGIIFVMNNALFDYSTPLEEMFANLHSFVNKEVLSDWEMMQGNKLLLYLNCCLAGRAYPFGYLPENLCDLVPMETYKFLIQLRPKSTSSINNEKPDGDCSFPNLRLLLKFDTRQFLNVISTCADAPLFANSDGRLKRLVDILVGIVESASRDELNDLGCMLLPFITTLLHKNAIPKDVHLFMNLIHHVLTHPFHNVRAQASAETSIVDLLRSVPEIDHNQVLQLALPLPYAHICAFVFSSRKQYVELLQCCLRNKLDQTHVFTVAQDLLAHLRDSELESVKQFLHSSINQLNAMDSYRTAELVLDNFPDFFGQTERISFVLLKNCFEIRRDKGLHSISGDEELDENLFGAYFEGIVNKWTASAEVKEVLDKQLTDLLAYWLPIGSRTDYCLNLAVGNDLLETSVLLLVSRTFVSRAFEMLFERLVKEQNRENISNQISMILKLSNSYQLEAKENQWLVKLFHFLLSSKDLSFDSKHFDTHLLDVFTSIVESGCDGAEQIIHELFSHPSFRNTQYSTFSKLINKMLVSCQVDHLLYRKTLQCMHLETIQRFSRLEHSTHNLFAGEVDSDVCVVCFQRISKSFLIFDCGHLAHIECCPEQRNQRRCVCENAKPSNLLCLHSKLVAMQQSINPTNPSKYINIFSLENTTLGPSQR